MTRIADRRVAYALAHKSARRTGRVSYAAKARIERLQKDFDAPLLNTARLVRRRDKLAAIIAHISGTACPALAGHLDRNTIIRKPT